MYLNLGQAAVVPCRSILGIFDLDNTTQSPRPRAFLERAERDGRLISLGDDLPKSFVVCQEKGRPPVVYISQLASSTLLRRAESGSLFSSSL